MRTQIRLFFYFFLLLFFVLFFLGYDLWLWLFVGIFYIFFFFFFCKFVGDNFQRMVWLYTGLKYFTFMYESSLIKNAVVFLTMMNALYILMMLLESCWLLWLLRDHMTDWKLFYWLEEYMLHSTVCTSVRLFVPVKCWMNYGQDRKSIGNDLA